MAYSFKWLEAYFGWVLTDQPLASSWAQSSFSTKRSVWTLEVVGMDSLYGFCFMGVGFIRSENIHRFDKTSSNGKVF